MASGKFPIIESASLVFAMSVNNLEPGYAGAIAKQT